MIPKTAFDGAWLRAEARRLNGCDPQLLERCIHALALLGKLQQAGIPLVFRGGTSLLLHLPVLHRLSIDIDILCSLQGEELPQALAPIGTSEPFHQWEEHERDPARMPKRRHFKFYFHSALGVQTQSANCILLDVVDEPERVHTTERKPIATSFLQPETEVLVEVPTLESLLGDKLTAFAPTTTGVPLRKADGTPGDVMQVVKQLFDVGTLFASASNGQVIADTYHKVQAKESAYRGGLHTAAASLDDTIRACLQLTPTQVRTPEKFPDHPLLWDGFNKLRSHLTASIGENNLRTLAARTACLAAHLRAGAAIDLQAMRYSSTPEAQTALKQATFKDTEWEWMDKQIKPVNPEAYHYWQQAIQIPRNKDAAETVS